MRGLQGSFPKCKKHIPSQNDKIRLVLEGILLIHNYHMEIVGSNKIKPVFNPEYEWYANVGGYDRIGNYYLQPKDYDSDDDTDEDD
jgi:hypothetical protein